MKNKKNKGWIAVLGEEKYNHLFGGNNWEVLDNNEVAGGPTLLLSLDLNDPKLSQLQIENLNSLPICSYINCDLWNDPQHFNILPSEKKVILVKHSEHSKIILDDEEKFPNPLPAKPLKLREMLESEVPSDEETYWKASDTFVGGSSFIRILGDPLWLESAEKSFCSCGKEQKYVCSIGYESDESIGVVDDKPFFIGEGALYFFLCSDCLILSVLSQST